ncbi:MAG: hypothetical protein HYT47_03065 [Candidatus Vogelbacteria bacterium]|nr:hypothetical protein [Candidatus Vogelbacteria bacterium]
METLPKTTSCFGVIIENNQIPPRIYLVHNIADSLGPNEEEQFAARFWAKPVCLPNLQRAAKIPNTAKSFLRANRSSITKFISFILKILMPKDFAILRKPAKPVE